MELLILKHLTILFQLHTQKELQILENYMKCLLPNPNPINCIYKKSFKIWLQTHCWTKHLKSLFQPFIGTELCNIMIVCFVTQAHKNIGLKLYYLSATVHSYCHIGYNWPNESLNFREIFIEGGSIRILMQGIQVDGLYIIKRGSGESKSERGCWQG